MTARATEKRQRDIREAYKLMLNSIDDPALEGVEIGRLNKAFALALSSDPLTKYKTTVEICECPDQGYRMRFICKHRLALMLRNRAQLFLAIWSGIKLNDLKAENFGVG